MKLLYKLIVYPLSKLPLFVLYRVEGFIFLLLYRLIGYRRQVVQANLKNSFPSMGQRDLQRVEKGFYRHLSRLLVESVKNLSISKEELLKRISVRNPEVLDGFYEQGKSVLLVGGHMYNWEYLITAQNLLFKHQAVGIGQPLSNSYWNKALNERRERFGMRVINAKNLKEKLNTWRDEKIAILVLFDQNPSNPKKAYWHTFLNRPTAFLFGTEKMAVGENMPVVQYSMHEKSKGHYEISLEVVTDQPREEEYGAITEKLIENLERQIQENPSYWLWSHKRWKHEPPSNMKEVRGVMEKNFQVWKNEL